MSLGDILNSDRVHLTPNSWYIHVPGHVRVSKEEFEQLWELKHRFQQQHIVLFGKRIPVPRIQGLFSARDVSYNFSGISVPSEPITSHAILEALLEQVTDTHNAVFANWYASGQDSVGAHSDDERDLVKGSCIISISLNATRTFRVKRKPKCDASSEVDKLDFQLGDGDVFIMGGAFQREFLHEVPKKARMVGDQRRINLTIRSFAPTGVADKKRKREQACHAK
ncbi:hypothetical protein CYMTET_5323 [Cymbomonas tetramitiformis]|uniref:Fe2OG dioxygenase domain-containing protein n=1 Tax=Cymbomonas tetramitiformis TaxID=36881 RepID=A0AAE0GZQ2_9CHLO|nr:hypothetical protein CYMTET_5323 [Cymbomonas tetramitiformis]